MTSPGKHSGDHEAGGSPRDTLLSPSALLVASVVLSAVLIMLFGWPGMTPLVAGGLVVIVWMHALTAAVERQWAELKTINWNAALPKAKRERERYVEGLRQSITEVLRPAVVRVGGLLKASLVVSATGLAVVVMLRNLVPEVAVAVEANRQPLMASAGLLVLLMMSVGWTIVRLRRAATAVSEVFIAIERALLDTNTSAG
ncbi:hypothetical protein ACFL6C_03155 [Myxococcota bacterium]